MEDLIRSNCWGMKRGFIKLANHSACTLFTIPKFSCKKIMSPCLHHFHDDEAFQLYFSTFFSVLFLVSFNIHLSFMCCLWLIIIQCCCLRDGCFGLGTETEICFARKYLWNMWKWNQYNFFLLMIMASIIHSLFLSPKLIPEN